MSDRASFVQKIILDPDEDTHRLVFADWLTEHTEFDVTWAELIRVQCLRQPIPWHVQRWLDKRFCLGAAAFSWVRKTTSKVSSHYSWNATPYPYADDVYFRCGGEESPDRIRVELVRGMVSGITCSPSDWCKIASSVYWHPKESGYGCPDTAHPIKWVQFTKIDNVFEEPPRVLWPGVVFGHTKDAPYSHHVTPRES